MYSDLEHILKTNIFTTYGNEDGLVVTKVESRTVVTVTEARQNAVAIARKIGGKKIAFLLDISEIMDLTKDARDYLASKERCKRFKALAMVVKTPLSQGIANFFLKVNKPIIPVKIFTSEADARAWLQMYV